MNICKNGEINIRILRRSDSYLLQKWLSNPQVLEYYEGRDHCFNEQMIQNKFYVPNPQKTRCIIEYFKEPIGYLQFYPLAEDEYVEYGYKALSNNMYGVDMFLGETQYWNKGIGTDTMKEIVKYLICKKGAQKILLDPQCRNTRAIACYKKSGFKKTQLLPDCEMHEGKKEDCWLMEYDAMQCLQ